MLELHFSLSSNFLFLALWQNNQCLISKQKENARLHSENFLIHLQRLLAECHYSLRAVGKVYFTSLPSGQTGLRISLAFLATLQVLNPCVKIYQLNTLLLQAGDANCLSLLTIDKQASKYYVAVYQEKKPLFTTRIISKENLRKLSQGFADFPLYQDFHQTDFLVNFQKLKNDFVLLRKIKEISIATI